MEGNRIANQINARQYAELLAHTLPKTIETEAENERALAIGNQLMTKGEKETNAGRAGIADAIRGTGQPTPKPRQGRPTTRSPTDVCRPAGAEIFFSPYPGWHPGLMSSHPFGAMALN